MICVVVLVGFWCFDALIRMGMKRNELGYMVLSKTGIFGTAGRRNWFPCGRNRVPGTKTRGMEIRASGNRLLLGRNRVPSSKFAK